MKLERSLSEISGKSSDIESLASEITGLIDDFDMPLFERIEEEDIDLEKLEELLLKTEWFDKIADWIKDNTPGGATGMNVDADVVINRIKNSGELRTKDILKQFAQLLEESK